MKKQLFFLTLFFTLIGLTGNLVHAQSQDDLDVINLDNLYKNSPPPQQVPVNRDPQPQSQSQTSTLPADIAPNPSDDQTQTQQPHLKHEDQQIMNELKDLSRLVPFRDVSVIQKKYLPKTGRMQLYGALGLTTNTPWFNNYGARLGFSYYFTEGFGLELSGMFIASSEREVAKEIREYNHLRPDQFIYTKGYYGLDLVWIPIYGKLSYIDDRIIPFDMYFSLGGGLSNTNSQEGNVPTFHIGTGQVFALSKSWAFRWDYSFNVFQATPLQDANATTTASKGSYNDLILTAGISFFFPEASER